MSSGIEPTDERYREVLAPRRLLRWLYVGRVTFATAILSAAIMVAQLSIPVNTFIATVVFVSAMVLTAFSFIRTEINSRPVGAGFLYLQLIHDLILITAIVHITGGPDSPFSALYILVNAVAALLLPIGSSLLLALLGSVLYAGDVIVVSHGEMTITLFLQLVVFSLSAVGTGYVATRLQAAGEGSEELRAELAGVQLRAADILANIRAAIISVDDGGRLLYANPTASQMLGVDLSDELGNRVTDTIRRQAPSVADAIALHSSDRKPVSRREGVLIKDGRALPLGITTTSVSGDLSQAQGVTTVIFQDITDEKRLEALRLRTQRLEAVAALSASLAHEIRNPLASIRSSVEQISLRSSATDDERTLGELIVRESDRLSRLLAEFLDFARVQVTRRDRLDLQTVVQGAVDLAATHPDRSALAEIDIRVLADSMLIVGDEDLLHRALFNLVLNAVQAIGEKGRIEVTVRPLQYEERPDGLPFEGAAHCIEIRDDGPGISPEVQDRLFEPFATTKIGGSGLGLAIVHRAIEVHSGVILVDSSRAGTCFTILLPAEATTDGV